MIKRMVKDYMIPVNNYMNWAYFKECGCYDVANDNKESSK